MAHDDQGRRWVLSTSYDYRAGRVCLVGAVAHAWPPSGRQDAHNLAWKLAAVVKGTAGAGLLDTYDQEWIAAAHGIGTQGAVLVRPDGFVAWRGIGPSPDPPPGSAASSAPC